MQGPKLVHWSAENAVPLTVDKLHAPTPPYFIDYTLDNGELGRLRVREIVSIEGVPGGGAVVEIVNQYRARTIRMATPAWQVREAHAAALAQEMDEAA